MLDKKQRILLHKKKEGLVPGTLVYVGDTEEEQTLVRSHHYSSEYYHQEEGFSKPQQGILWVEITGLKDIRHIVKIAKEFSLSNLSLEDVFSTDQRLKVDRYDSYLSATLRILGTQETPEQQLSLFLGSNWVLSIAENKSELFEPLIRQLATNQTKLQTGSAGMLFHSLMDRVVDQYLVRADELELKTEHLEELVITSPQTTDAPTIHQHKAEILRLRRMTSPLREILTTLLRSESEYLDKNTLFLLRDIQDHALWLSEECDMLRETVSGIMEVYLSSLDMRMNTIMKVLTIISTIFIPMTFLTGLYGMNFTVMPFTTAWWGFYAILLCCVLVVAFMIVYFRRKRWW
ncbi:MAG: magnesium/cobalt transporter CorA [Spirochaetales bacterium]|jgi:magnesium transporter|nr:magnesium/cobalt transporter CorA [Spirochaetales bacterium]